MKKYLLEFRCTIVWLMFFVLSNSFCLARVFDMNKEKKASYLDFLVSPANSSYKQQTFINETTSTTVSYDSSWAYNYSGEIGFFYNNPNFGLRFGFEILKPDVLKSVLATDSASTNTYAVTSAITGYAPKIGLEMYFVRSSDFRVLLLTYYGTASVSYKNEYTIVSYPSVVDHTIEAKGASAIYGGALGIETFMSDTTTFIFSAGYRSLKIDELAYTKITPEGSATFNGTPVVGDKVLLNDGTKRTLDFTGVTISLGFRIYL